MVLPNLRQHLNHLRQTIRTTDVRKQTSTTNHDRERQNKMTAATDTRDKAIAQVATNTNPAWATETMLIIKQIATNTFDFTTDDIWQALSETSLPTPHEPRALGALMIAAQRAGLIAPTDRYRQSKRPECHARPIRVWQAT